MTVQEQMRDVLERVKAGLPSYVDELLLEQVGSDAGGKDAVWVYAIFDQDAISLERITEDATAIKDALRAAMKAAGLSHWLFLLFRSREEQAAVNGENPELTRGAI